ncbi:DUF2889 domain-containing protein [Leptospira broomii]|nr:DUF2889 domain-containing protein [Leptospira broomii]
MALSQLKQKIRFKDCGFQRRYESRYYWFPEESPPSCLIEASQRDSYHDMTLYMLINLTNMKIIDLDVEEDRVPYETCPQAIKTYSYLIGEEISYSKIMRKFPVDKTAGCLHINELLQNAAQSFSSAYAFFLKERNFPPELDEYRMYAGTLDARSRREIGRHWWMKDRGVRNSCFSFSAEHETAELKEQVKPLDSITAMMVKEFRGSRNDRESG